MNNGTRIQTDKVIIEHDEKQRNVFIYVDGNIFSIYYDEPLKEINIDAPDFLVRNMKSKIDEEAR